MKQRRAASVQGAQEGGRTIDHGIQFAFLRSNAEQLLVDVFEPKAIGRVGARPFARLVGIFPLQVDGVHTT